MTTTRAWRPLPWQRQAARQHALAERLFRLGPTFGPGLAVIVLQQVFFPMPLGLVIRGVVVGGLTALIAIGMALIYRSNRILNFAQADLGGVPAVLVVMLITAWGWNYYLAATAGLAASILMGGLVELVVIRRFFKAPRLILTVATIGLAQVLAAGAVLLPRLWGQQLYAPRIEAPFHVSFSVSGIVFGANDLIAMLAVPMAIIGLTWFLQRTDFGVAIRASAENADRASLLGVPVKKLQTLVWAVASLLAFVATFLRAGILGLPIGLALSFGILLRSLAALMMGRLTNLTAITTSAVALGVLELGVGWNASSPLLIDPILALVVAVALMAQRRGTSRQEQNDASSWQTAEEVRPIPPELASLRQVKVVRWAGGLAVLAVALALPNFLSVDRSLKASAVIIYGILGLSLIVLTGWAGQVSLGQVAFFAIGAVVGAKVIQLWHADLIVALLAAAAAGALVAALVGLPALRLQGLYLAVITFAFALATTSYFLNQRFFAWVPSQRVERLPILGRVAISSPTGMYYVALGGLGVAVFAIRGMRRSRTGRVLIALRENERAAQAFGVSALRAKLGAFAASGAVAAYAGCLFVVHQQAFGQAPYDPGQNLSVFTMAVIGGVGSIPGVLVGALYLRGAQWFLPTDWQLLASGAGVLFVLLVIPGGIGGVLYQARDHWLRWVAKRSSVIVPSLLADVRQDHPPSTSEPRSQPAAVGEEP